MNITWEVLPKQTQQSVLSSLSRLCLRMSARSSAISIYSIGQLGVPLTSLTDQVTMSIELAARKLEQQASAQDVVQTLSGLQTMHFSWKSLSVRTQTVLAMSVYRLGFSLSLAHSRYVYLYITSSLHFIQLIRINLFTLLYLSLAREWSSGDVNNLMTLSAVCRGLAGLGRYSHSQLIHTNYSLYPIHLVRIIFLLPIYSM